jgi:hypothetical protein
VPPLSFQKKQLSDQLLLLARQAFPLHDGQATFLLQNTSLSPSWTPRQQRREQPRVSVPPLALRYHTRTRHAVIWFSEELFYSPQWSRVRFPIRSLDF